LGIEVGQYGVLRHDRTPNRASEAERAEQERIQKDRRARRDSWEPVFEEIDGILMNLADIESEVRKEAPRDRDAIDAAGLGRIRSRLENIFDRCPNALTGPLLAVAAEVAKLRKIIILPDTEVTDEYARRLTSTPPSELPPEDLAQSAGGKAIDVFPARTSRANVT
jgi:hypothetical protein